MKKIAVFDIDGTLFRWQLYHELVFELKKLGYFTGEALDLDAALTSWQGRQISWSEYETKVVHVIEHNIATIAPDVLETAAKNVVEASGHKIYNYTAKLLRSLQAEGYFTIAISGSQHEIAEQFATRYGFDECIGSLWERRDGTYTGHLSREVVGRKDQPRLRRRPSRAESRRYGRCRRQSRRYFAAKNGRAGHRLQPFTGTT